MLQLAHRSRQSQGRLPFSFLFGFLIAIFLIIYFNATTFPSYIYTSGTASINGTSFEYQVTTSDVFVDWSGGPDFDPKDKCPQDFFTAGFKVLYKKLADGAYFTFLYHKGKKLLYRIDKDIIRGKARIGLHWVEGTNYGAKYRIADEAFKGGKTVQVPNAKGGTDATRFQYGQAVAKRKVQPGRELFQSTHIQAGQCPEWWDIFNFIP